MERKLTYVMNIAAKLAKRGEFITHHLFLEEMAIENLLAILRFLGVLGATRARIAE